MYLSRQSDLVPAKSCWIWTTCKGKCSPCKGTFWLFPYGPSTRRPFGGQPIDSLRTKVGRAEATAVAWQRGKRAKMENEPRGNKRSERPNLWHHSDVSYGEIRTPRFHFGMKNQTYFLFQVRGERRDTKEPDEEWKVALILCQMLT